MLIFRRVIHTDEVRQRLREWGDLEPDVAGGDFEDDDFITNDDDVDDLLTQVELLEETPKSDKTALQVLGGEQAKSDQVANELDNGSDQKVALLLKNKNWKSWYCWH